jgi:hypothetical protein
MARPRTKPHPGELSRAELAAAIALLKPKQRVPPTDAEAAAAQAKALATRRINQAEAAAEAERALRCTSGWRRSVHGWRLQRGDAATTH